MVDRPVLYAGIDPGLDGGIVIVTTTMRPYRAELMPVLVEKKGRSRRRRLDEIAVRDILTSESLRLVTLEALPRGHPGLRGVNSAVTMGVHHGLLRGLLAGLQIPYLLAAPQRWQQEMCPGSGDPKVRSIQATQQLFPTLDLTPGQRTTPHDGLADAALLAVYGMRMYGPKRLAQEAEAERQG